MRIIAGEFRGRHLLAPRDKTIRPTTDRLRESIFNALTSQLGTFEGLQVADIFAGTGAFALESLSRGASGAILVEKHFDSLNLLRQNLARLGVEKKVEILTADARNLPRRGGGFDLIFMDPPYGQGLALPALDSLLAGGWAVPATLVVVERAKKDDFELPEGLEEIKSIKQGKRVAQFLTVKA